MKLKSKIALFLVAALLIPIFSALPVGALEYDFDDFMITNDGFICTKGDIVAADSEHIEFLVRSRGSSLEGSTSLTSEVSDTLMIIMSNLTSATRMAVNLYYSDGTAETVYCDLEPMSGRRAYCVNIKQNVHLIKYRMNFINAEGGSVLLYSVSELNRFNADFESLGEISSVAYDKTQKHITVKGTLKYDAVKQFSGATFSVYALSAVESVDDIYNRDEKEPIISGEPMAIRFSFAVPVSDNLSRLSKYVVAVDTGTEIIAVAPPVYPAVDSSLTDNDAFKGAETELISGILDACASSAVVDVQTEKLESTGNNGYLIKVDGIRYYIDRTYVSALDAKMTALNGAGCKIYIRLTSDSTGVAAYDIASQLKLYAFVEFLCSRYSTDETGRVAGIIIGSSDGRFLPESMREKLTLSEYAETLCETVFTICAAANDAGDSVEVAIPVSDMYAASDGAGLSNDDFPTELLLDSVYCAAGFFGGLQFTVVLESTHNPYGINDDYIKTLASMNTITVSESETAADSEETVPQESLKKNDARCDFVSAETIEAFCDMLAELNEAHNSGSDDVIYLWKPSSETTGTALTAAYVYNYYRLFSSGRVSAFVVSFVGGELSENGDYRMNDAKYKMRYIDTGRSAEISYFALDCFGITSWTDEFRNFDINLIASRVINETGTLVIGRPQDIIGSCPYWDFSVYNSTAGWYSGLNCGALSINNSGGTRSLSADFTTGKAGEYSFFAYNYKYKESFKYTDYIIFTFIFLSENNDDKFELNITLGGKSFVYEFKADGYLPGQEYVVRIDVSDFTEKMTVDNLRIGAKNLGTGEGGFTINLMSVTAGSRTFDDSTLEHLIQSERDRLMSLDAEPEGRSMDSLWIIIILGVVSATVAVMIMVNHGKNKKARPQDRA